MEKMLTQQQVNDLLVVVEILQSVCADLLIKDAKRKLPGKSDEILSGFAYGTLMSLIDHSKVSSTFIADNVYGLGGGNLG